MICVLLGTFSIVCLQRYLNRGSHPQTVAGSAEEQTAGGKASGEPSDELIEKHTPEPLADLSSDPVEPTPIADTQANAPSLNDENLGDSIEEKAPRIAENASSNSAGIESDPFDQDAVEKDQGATERAQDSLGQKVAATPVSEGKINSPIEEDLPEFPAESKSTAPPASLDPAPSLNAATPVNPNGLTKLEDIEANEPATLKGLEPVDTAEATPRKQQDEFDTFEKAAPPIIKQNNPVSVTDREENDLDQSMSRFREVKIDSRQSSGTTKVVAAEPGGPTPRLEKNTEDPSFDDELPNQDEFEAPTATRREPQPIRKADPVASPIFDEEPTPLVNTPAQRKEREAPLGDLEGDQYTVLQRDTYWKISKQKYGTVRYFLALARYNQDQVPNPKLMRPGTKIIIPPADVLEQQFPELLPKKKDPGSVQNENPGPQFFMEAGVPRYRVGPKDNLSVISGRYLGDESRWDEIYQLNQELLRDANRLPVGTILALPPEASSHQMVREPREYR